MKGGLVAVLLLACFLGAVVSQNCGCAPGLCCSKWGYCGTGPDYCTGSGSTTSSPGTSSTTGTSGSCNLGQIFSQADFNALFPFANGGSGSNPIFTYNNLIQAAAYYPTFGCTGDVKTRKTELAAFLAQTSQETSGWWTGQEYKYGYYFSAEVGCTNTGCQYCQPSSTYPCAGGKGYYGRGPLQLSWNYNYGQVSRAVFGDDRLLNDPDQLLSSGVTAFRTSIWFWMTAQNPKPSCHNVMTGLWTPSGTDISIGRLAGFGMTTNIINGGLECNQPTPQKVTNRVGYFTRYMKYFYPNDSPGNNLYCDRMTKY